MPSRFSDATTVCIASSLVMAETWPASSRCKTAGRPDAFCAPMDRHRRSVRFTSLFGPFPPRRRTRRTRPSRCVVPLAWIAGGQGDPGRIRGAPIRRSTAIACQGVHPWWGRDQWRACQEAGLPRSVKPVNGGRGWTGAEFGRAGSRRRLARCKSVHLRLAARLVWRPEEPTSAPRYGRLLRGVGRLGTASYWARNQSAATRLILLLR